MNKSEYDMIQKRLTSLMSEKNLQKRILNAGEREIYMSAVLDCKEAIMKFSVSDEITMDDVMAIIAVIDDSKWNGNKWVQGLKERLNRTMKEEMYEKPMCMVQK